MTKIIVSYRRSDSAAIAGRIFDRLTQHYGQQSVFMDIDNIPFGIDFRKYIHSVLNNSDILVEVMGPKWVGPNRRGFTRIKEEADPVRIEVETALQKGIPVIPVLVDGANMPKVSDLPDSLKDFIFLNAAPVDVGRDFHQHVDRLIRHMDEFLADAKPMAAVITASAASPPIVDGPPEMPTLAGGKAAKPSSVYDAAELCISTILLLIVVHVLLVWLDVPLVCLRTAPIAISFVFGMVLLRRLQLDMRYAVVVGAIVGILAIIGMVAVTVVLEKVPMLPRDSYEWIAVIEYTTSMTLATIAGNASIESVRRLLFRTTTSKTVFASAAIALATILGSLYFGLHHSIF